MADRFKLILSLVLDLFRSRTALEDEDLVLRQMIVLRRVRVGRSPFLAAERMPAYLASGGRP
jgi:hypothetical protein